MNFPFMRKLTILLVSSLTIMSVVTISPALPEMTEAFGHLENAAFLTKLLMTVPALMIALSAVVTGVLIDKYGRLRFLRIAVFAYALAGAAGFWLESLYQILISRIILGIAVGLTMTIVTTLVADYFEGKERQKFIGIQIAFMSMGGILFLGLGGVLADVSWRHPFLIYLYALIILPLCFLYLTEPKRDFDSKDVISSEKSPPVIWMLFFNTMLMWILFFLIPVQLPFLLKDIGIEQNSLIGVAIALSTAFSAVSSFSYSKIKNRLGFLMIFAIGYAFMAVAYFLLATASGYAVACMATILAGLGMGMMIPNTNMWVMKIAPPVIRGKEIGKLTTFWFMGQFLSPIVLLLPVFKGLSLSGIFNLAAYLLAFLFLAFLVLHLIPIGKRISE